MGSGVSPSPLPPGHRNANVSMINDVRKLTKVVSPGDELTAVHDRGNQANRVISTS